MSFMAAFDESGRCKYVFDGDTDTLDLTNEAAVVFLTEKLNPDQIWYDSEAGEMRGKSPFPVSVYTNRVEGIPTGTTAYVGGEPVVVDTGVLEFEVAYPEVVRVFLRHVRHLDLALEVPCEVQS